MSLYEHTVTVSQMSNVQTSVGTFNPTYTELIASLTCALQHNSVATGKEYNRLTYITVVKMFCDYNSETSSINEKDRIVVSSEGKNASFAGEYEIESIVDAGGKQHHFEIMLKKVS